MLFDAYFDGASAMLSYYALDDAIFLLLRWRDATRHADAMRERAYMMARYAIEALLSAIVADMPMRCHILRCLFSPYTLRYYFFS